jgi:hypothetical protein
VTIGEEVGAFLSGAEGAMPAAVAIERFFGESSCDQEAQGQLIQDLLVLEQKNAEVRFCLDGAGLQLMRRIPPDARDVLLIRRGVVDTPHTRGITYEIEQVSTTQGPVSILRRRRSPGDVLTSPELVEAIRAKMLEQGRPVLLILGPARKKIFTDEKPYSPTSRDAPIRQRNELYLLMRLVLEGAMAAFFDARVQPALAEGGWSGVIEAEFGAPMLAYQLAIAHDLIVFQFMPKDGEYNSNQQPTVHRIAGLAWGDDSPTLIAIGDAAIVFQPAGAWTDVEIENLVASDKPIAFVWTNGSVGSVTPDARHQHFVLRRGGSRERGDAFDRGREVGQFLIGMLRRTTTQSLSRSERAQLGAALARL